jgi:Gluconate 2-dehydrogenase subunit 3
MGKEWYFLSEGEGRFFEALCETIVPEGKDPAEDPGALTVGGLSYIDSSLWDMSPGRQEYFRQSIGLVEDLSRALFSRNFCGLDQPQRTRILKELYLNPKTREQMFDLRSIVLEAFYSDFHIPNYAGMTGWQYVHFGGKRISDVKKDWTFLKVWKDQENKE